MINKIKLGILNSLSYIRCIFLRLRGVSVGAGCRILGTPVISIRKGGSIILGEDVTLISNVRYNPLVEKPIFFKTLNPEAVIHLENHSGVSGCSIITDNKVSIGEYTIVGPNTLIMDVMGHEYSPETGWRGKGIGPSLSIQIGRKCYIGTRCIIMTGVTIGDNCVVAAGCVVDKSIPSGHMAIGNPMVIKPLPKMLGGVRKQSTSKKLSS